jgi:hypothetical protein
MDPEKDTTPEGEEELPEGEQPEGEEPEGEEPEGEKDDKGQKSDPADDKEKNRKGFEIRQQQKVKKEGAIASLTKRLTETEAKLSVMEEVSKDQEFRKSHPEVSDELFNLIKSASKGSGKSYDDSLNDPVIKSVIDVNHSKTRIERSTPSPSTKTSPGGGKSVWDETPDEFKQHQEEVLRRG